MVVGARILVYSSVPLTDSVAVDTVVADSVVEYSVVVYSVVVDSDRTEVVYSVVADSDHTELVEPHIRCVAAVAQLPFVGIVVVVVRRSNSRLIGNKHTPRASNDNR